MSGLLVQGAGGVSDERLRAERLRKLGEARLYVCTDARSDRGDLEEFLRACFVGGVDIVQLRDKGISAAEEVEALLVLRRVARECGGLFAVNDRADVAALVGADVFHVGQDDLSPAQARELLGGAVVIGRSTHSAVQADAAIADVDVDYFACGPIWETPTKPGRAAVGLDYVRYVASTGTGKPWFGIGGVNGGTLSQVLAAGASRVVVVRAVTQAVDPLVAARGLKDALV